MLFSVHLKATMMKVSDPIIFGHAVRAYFAEVRPARRRCDVPGWSPNDGLGALLKATEDCRGARARGAIEPRTRRPRSAMVDSDRGITNLHVPSDVIIDASMPAAIRSSGQMWNDEGEQQDTKFVIPDHSYAPLYAETVDHCREHGAFDPATMGTTPNVGPDGPGGRGVRLARQDVRDRPARHRPRRRRRRQRRCSSTRSRPATSGGCARPRTPRSRTGSGWRSRAPGRPAGRRCSGSTRPRAHDAQLLEKVRPALEELDTDGLQIEILDVAAAARFTLERARRGEDTISVTGNVLRDYLTDLFPILELGTSAKMQSIVPLIAGGGLFETGAGGSAPKHVQQFLKENHLRWDSLGEFLALGPSLELLADKDRQPARRSCWPSTLDRAIGRVLEENRSPSRKAGELDNRGSHFYLALYWAQELAAQDEDAELAARFAPLAERLAAERASDRRGAERRAGLAGRHRRLLPARPGADGCGDAPERHLQRGARVAHERGSVRGLELDPVDVESLRFR